MNRTTSLRVLVADPHTMVCEGIAEVLSRLPQMEVVGQAQCGQETMDLFCLLRPDVLVMERDFPDMDGRTVIAILHQQFPSAGILVLSLQEGDEAIYTALQAGAKGYLFKEASAEALEHAIRAIH